MLIGFPILREVLSSPQPSNTHPLNVELWIPEAAQATKKERDNNLSLPQLLCDSSHNELSYLFVLSDIESNLRIRGAGH